MLNNSKVEYHRKWRHSERGSRWLKNWRRHRYGEVGIPKPCVICNSIFKPRTSRVVSCSPKCQRVRAVELNKKSRHERQEIKCRVCNNVFKNRGRKLHFYCSYECKKTARSSNKARQYQRLKERLPELRSVTCAACGKNFMPRTRRVWRRIWLCSKSCERKRQIQTKKIWVSANRERVNAQARARTAKHRQRMKEIRKKHYDKNRLKIRALALRKYLEGPSKPTGERQWLSKNKVQLRNVKRYLRNRRREQSQSSPPTT